MKLLGCSNNPNYKLAMYLDSRAMISVETEKYGLVDVKPLGVIWGKYPQYTKDNTIMFDDLRRNFLMNPQNGLKIRPFREVNIVCISTSRTYLNTAFIYRLTKIEALTMS